MSFQLRNFYQYKWDIIEQQGECEFEISDSSCFYESFSQNDMALKDWIDHFKRKKKPFLLAKGVGSSDPNTHWCLFTPPRGPNRSQIEGIKDTSEPRNYTLHLPELL